MAFSNKPASLSPSHNNQHEVKRAEKDHVLDQKKLKKIGRVLCNTITRSPVECLIMIDILQHLSIDYHFQDEIKFVLSTVYESLEDVGDYNLSEVALGFRLLRQEGYHVTTDVFNKFVDEDGKFAENLRDDITGMISLYQASEFAIEGDDILDHANAFVCKNIRDAIPQLVQDQANVVNNIMKQPYHKTLTRFKVKSYISSRENEQATTYYDVLLQEVAKMDFNIVQTLHQRELREVSSWWRDLGLAKNMEFARDQPVKWYMWSMATLADPVFSEERIDLTKPIALVYIMDDIFDVYGTLDELVLFTEAIKKWELEAIEQVPYCMKIFFKALHDITDEISSKILKKHGWNPINSLVKAWRGLCDAFLVEAKWFASGQLPSSEEYLKNGLISSGVHVICVHIFFLLGQGINKKNVDLLDNFPGLISCVAMILRLWDDLGSAKDENQQGYDGSYIDCYMKEHKSSTIESAQEHVVNMISNTWKTLNKECLLQNSFPLSFKKAILNAARMVCMMYSYDANQRLPILEKQIKSMLYESIPL
nr:terpene synthase 28_QD [Aquilegia viridiflora var. atropurpurea]